MRSLEKRVENLETALQPAKTKALFQDANGQYYESVDIPGSYQDRKVYYTQSQIDELANDYRLILVKRIVTPLEERGKVYETL